MHERWPNLRVDRVLRTLALGSYGARFWRFKNVAVAPADPILGLAAQFKEDKEPKKINLGIGACAAGWGKPRRWAAK